MHRLYWREQSKLRVFKLPGGKLKTLGKGKHRATRENPPPEVMEA